jgi:hypothetical protein
MHLNIKAENSDDKAYVWKVIGKCLPVEAMEV